jgi:hypothetical protein
VDGAEKLHLARLWEQRENLNSKLPTNDSTSGETLQRQIRQLDQAIFSHNRSPTELLNQMVRGAAALDAWLSILLHQTRDGALITSQRAEIGEGHITAERWLISAVLPALYKSAFDRMSVGKRGTIEPITSKPSGPKLAFICAALAEFGVKNADGKSLSGHTIDEYLRVGRKRRGKRVQSRK